MEITQLVAMAERIHDAEDWDLGTDSTREGRNKFWARAISCAHFGHSVYNPVADPQWSLKRATASSPQTDDVATSLPTRAAWDCIPGAGTDNYSFHADYIGILPPGQVVYPPPIPDDATMPTPVQPYPSEPDWWGPVFTPAIQAQYTEAGRVFPDTNTTPAGIQATLDGFRWWSRTGYKIRDGMTKEVAMADTVQELRKELGLG